MSVEQGASVCVRATKRRPRGFSLSQGAPTTRELPTTAHKRRKLQLLANNSYLVVAAAAAANSNEHVTTTKPQAATTATTTERQHFSEQTTTSRTSTRESDVTTAFGSRDFITVEPQSCKPQHNVHQQQDDTTTSRLIGASTTKLAQVQELETHSAPTLTSTTTTATLSISPLASSSPKLRPEPVVVAAAAAAGPESSGASVRVPITPTKWYLDHPRLSLRFLSVPKGAQRLAHKPSRLMLLKLKTTITSSTSTSTIVSRPRRKQRQRQRQRERRVGEEEAEECKLGAPVKLEPNQSQCRAKAQTGATKSSAPPPPPPPRALVVSSEKVEQLELEHLQLHRRRQQSQSYAKISDQSKRESDYEDRRKQQSCTTDQFNKSSNSKKCQHLYKMSRCLHKRAAPSSSSSSWTSSWLRPITASGPLYALLLVFILMQACDSQFIGTNNNGADLEAPPLVGANEVAYVDLRVKENSIQHHTILYEQIDHVNPLNPTGPSMVLRRGELFNIIIHLRHTYNKQTDKIRLEFSFGQRPQVGKGTLIYLPITKDRDTFGRDPSKWDARVVRVDGNQLSVQINLPANIAVGVWRFRVSTKLAGSRTIRTYTCKEALYMIFNAWSKDDAVYLSREDARQEYVLNDVGKIYIGSHAKPRGRKWIYGQFQESVLPAVMFMLDKTRLDIVGRSSVVKVARAVSAMVNSHDDNGLLVGNWSGNYGDGLAPWQWTGSATILEKYLQSGGEPVKFGQCWVFAGVTTTALRTLGIPARTVSNFVSAHDTDDSLTVDKFFSEKGDPISDVNSDSIWNFHVWSDAWMARNDLPPGYGGWQAVDATPQETSMGMYQMGPASLEAIKKGEVGFAYDAAFVFAEVNADIVHWQQDDKSELQWKKIKTLKFHIGRKIFTKMIGQLDDYTANGVADAEDIISQYKNKEGTEDERMSVLNAARCGGLGFLFEQPAPGKEDVEFELFDIDKVQLGEPFLITVRIANKSPMRRTISLALSASSVYYTGILAQKVKRDRQNIVLNGLQEQQVRIRVNPDDYMERLVDYSMMKVYAIATVKETQQTWSKEDDFMIDKALLAGSS